jgi:hypothetical protein
MALSNMERMIYETTLTNVMTDRVIAKYSGTREFDTALEAKLMSILDAGRSYTAGTNMYVPPLQFLKRFL